MEKQIITNLFNSDGTPFGLGNDMIEILYNLPSWQLNIYEKCDINLTLIDKTKLSGKVKELKTYCHLPMGISIPEFIIIEIEDNRLVTITLPEIDFNESFIVK